MKKIFCFLKAFFQLCIIAGLIVFFYYGYKHLDGNFRFIRELHSARFTVEGRWIKGFLLTSYPTIESITPLDKVTPNDPIRVYLFRQKEKTPLLVAKVTKDIPCASCKGLDFLLVTDLKGAIQKIQLIAPLESDNKKIDGTAFLKQFEGKKFESAIEIGKEIEGIKEAPTVAQGMVMALNEALDQIKVLLPNKD